MAAWLAPLVRGDRTDVVAYYELECITVVLLRVIHFLFIIFLLHVSYKYKNSKSNLLLHMLLIVRWSCGDSLPVRALKTTGGRGRR